MKNFLKYLLLGLLTTLASFSYAQIVPTTVTGGVVTISGKGKLGGIKDGAQWRRYKFARSGSFYLSAYIRSLTNSGNSFTGIAFRNETNAEKTDGGIPCVGIFLENDTLKVKVKQPTDTRFVDIAVLPGVKAPVGLKIVKDGNNLLCYYTTSAETSTAPSYVLVSTVQSVFNSGWTKITQNFATGNRLGSAATAVVTKIAFGAVTETNTNPCANGGTFDILSITKRTGTLYDVAFNASGLYNVNIDVKNSSNVSVRNYSTGVTSNPLSVDVSTLPAGTYTMKLTGESCSGTASKTFTVSSSPVSAPTITSVPTIPISGSTVTFTATGCTSTVNWYRNNTINGVQGTSASLTVANPTATNNYFAKCVVSGIESVGSNLIEVVEPTPTGGGQTVFVNILKTVPVETQTDKYSVAPFSVTGGTKLKNIANGRQKAIFPVIWHTKLTNFVAANKKTWDLGISSPVDIVPNLAGQEGDGVRCLDYILYANPNTGLPYANGIDTDCNLNINTFISRRPFQFRVKGEGGTLESMAGWSLERYYDEGVAYTNGDKFGFGDVVNGKNNIAFNVTDVENGEHGRFEEIPISIGMGNTTFGDAVSMYNQCINIVNPELSHYPLNYITGGYVANRIKLDGTIALDGNGNLQQNNVINDAWKPENKVTISSRGINNKGLIDFENVKESSEVSCLSSAAFHQGELINYDNNNKSLTRVTNKFGLNRNAEHIVAHTKYATEVRKWHLRKNFNDRDFFTLTKDLCDRLNVGLTNYGKFGSYVDNEELRAMHLPRDLTFINSMVTAFNGSYIYEWDRNTAGKIVDSKNAKLFAINLLNQRKNLSQGSLSFVDLFNSFDFKLWTAEISYDGGNTWKQEKGTDLIMNQTSVTHLQCISPNGVWAVFIGRPEKTEALTCKLRITYNGVIKYLDITPSMWETTNPTYANTPLVNIPNAAKDYFYDLVDVSGNGTSQGGTVTAPTITKNVANPAANESVTLTSSGCQSASYTTKWYDSAEGNLIQTSLTLTVNAVNGNGYYAKCVGTSASSVQSNTITFSITPPPSTGVTITTPSGYTATSFSGNQPKSYWDNQANIPAIFMNVPQYVENTDVVTMQNSQMIIKIDLKAGGQICFAATTSNPTKNLVYIGYDRGFQWQADYTQHLEGGVINGQTSGSPQNNTDYNTTQGGDYLNHGTHLTDYYATADGFYTEVRPILYPFNSVMSQVKIQTTYKLVGNMLKISYRYISFRTDPGLETGNAFRFKGFDLPVMFCLEEYSKYAYYAGGSPWENTPMSEGDVPNNTQGGQFLGANSTERWAMVWNPANSQAIGVFNKSVGGTATTVGFEQLNKFVGSSQGTNTSGPYTVMKVSDTESVPNGGSYVHESEAWITFGDKSLIRGRFDAIKNN